MPPTVLLPAACRRRVLPMVSKLWTELLVGTSSAWERVVIDADADFPDLETELDTVGMLLWFCERARSIKQLAFLGNLPMLSPSLLTSILMSQSASLQELEISVAGIYFCPADLAVLAALTALKRLTVALPDKHEDEWVDDTGSALIRVISSLPALEILEIREFLNSRYTAVPSIRTLARLQSTTLSSLFITTSHVPDENILILGALPGLITFSLATIAFSEEALYVPESAFEGVLSMADIAIIGASRLQLAPNCFRRHTMLSVVCLRDCGLSVVPAALLGVKTTLRHLDLSFNAGLEIDQAGFGTLLALPILEYVDLHKREVSWAAMSLRFLVTFLSAWQMRYPRSKQPSLTI